MTRDYSATINEPTSATTIPLGRHVERSRLDEAHFAMPLAIERPARIRRFAPEYRLPERGEPGNRCLTGPLGMAVAISGPPSPLRREGVEAPVRWLRCHLREPTKPTTVASIHEGCRRNWKFRRGDILPPIDALEGFFNLSPHFVLDGPCVSAVEPLDYHTTQGEVAATMIDVLISTPHQIMDRHSLEQACRDAGIKKGTYTVWTTYAEWIEHFAPNVWGIRGSKPSPAAVEVAQAAAAARRRSEPRRTEWAWDVSGNIVQTMFVTTSFLRTGVMSFDREIHGLLAGRSIEIHAGGVRVATVKLGGSHWFSWGWHPALEALNASVGKVLRIKVDLATRRADVFLGGSELWV